MKKFILILLGIAILATTIGCGVKSNLREYPKRNYPVS